MSGIFDRRAKRFISTEQEVCIRDRSMLDGEWAKAVGAEFKKPYYRDL